MTAFAEIEKGDCSFCGTSAGGLLLASGKARICIECVALCKDIVPESRPSPMSRSSNHLASSFNCSFCGASQESVGSLIAGPAVFICDTPNKSSRVPFDAPVAYLDVDRTSTAARLQQVALVA